MDNRDSADKSEVGKRLISLGFSPNQAEVYLALLRLGKGTVSEIARAAGINRTTGYDILDSLVDRGLVSRSGREPKQEYVSEPPENLITYLELQAKEAASRADEVKGIIPELASIRNVYGRPKVMFYEGEEGLKRAYEDTLTSQETIQAYANVEDMHAALPNYFPAYYKRRSDKGIGIRAILPANPAGEERSERDREEMRETALVPASEYFFSPEINIYDDKIMIASWREKLGIIIQSNEIAEAMKSIFKLAWSEAQRLDVRSKKEDNRKA